MHRRCASSLVSGALALMISRKWRKIAADTAAFLVFRAGHALTTSARKNWGDLQTRVPPVRDHTPTGATEWLGIRRNLKSFVSASGTGICAPPLLPSHLIAV